MRPTRPHPFELPLLARKRLILERGKLFVQLGALSFGPVDFVKRGRFQVFAMLLDEGRHCFGVELAPGDAKPSRKLLSRLEDWRRDRYGSFHVWSITRVIPR